MTLLQSDRGKVTRKVTVYFICLWATRYCINTGIFSLSDHFCSCRHRTHRPSRIYMLKYHFINLLIFLYYINNLRLVNSYNPALDHGSFLSQKKQIILTGSKDKTSLKSKGRCPSPADGTAGAFLIYRYLYVTVIRPLYEGDVVLQIYLHHCIYGNPLTFQRFLKSVTPTTSLHETAPSHRG